jgi:uncharacterized protein YbbK (DUF523 family)
MEEGERNHQEEPVIRLGISTCLLGERVRFDGGHKHDRYLTGTLGQFFEWVPVCPEVEIGLPIPRESMRLVGDAEDPRLIAPKSGTDYTDQMKAWARTRVEELAAMGLHGFVFKKTWTQLTNCCHRDLAHTGRIPPSHHSLRRALLARPASR